MLRLLPVVLVVAGATVASAQGYPGGGGGRGGGMGGGMGGMGGRGGRGGPGGMSRGEAPVNPTEKDVEKQDPVKLLLDKHKKLKLDKTQIARLDTLGVRLRAQNGPFYLRVDSLHKTFKAPSGGGFRSMSDDDRLSMMENRQSLFETLTQVRENNRAARDGAVAVLREPQKQKAYELLEKQLEESDKLMRQPGGGEGGMGGGRRRPPGGA